MAMPKFLKTVFEAVAKAFEPPVNMMSNGTVNYISEEVRAKTDFDVACYDSRAVNMRQNVGLVIPEGADEAKVEEAAEVFMLAAMDRGERVMPDNLIIYSAEKSPGEPSRLVQPRVPFRFFK